MESKCKSEEFVYDGNSKDQEQILEFITKKSEANHLRSYFDKSPDYAPGLVRSSSLNSLLNHNQNMAKENSPVERQSKPFLGRIRSMEALLCNSSPWIMEGLPKDADKHSAKIFESDVEDDHKLVSTTFTISDKQFSDQAAYVYYSPTKCNLSPRQLFGSDEAMDSPITALSKKLARCHLTERTSEPSSKKAIKGGSQATTAGDDYNDFGNNNASLIEGMSSMKIRNANEINVEIVDSPLTSLTKVMRRCKLTEACIEHVPEKNKDVNELAKAYPEENKYENELASPYIEQLPEEDKYVTELPEAYIENVPEENKYMTELSGANIEHLFEKYEDELSGAHIELFPEETNDVNELSGLVPKDHKDENVQSEENANYYNNENEGQDDKLDGSLAEATMVNANTPDNSFSFLDEPTLVNNTETEKIMRALLNSDSGLSMPPIDNEIDEDFIDATTGLDDKKNDITITEDSLKNIVDSPLKSKVDFDDANNSSKSKKLKSLRVKFNDALTSIFEYPSEKSLTIDNGDDFLGIGA